MSKSARAPEPSMEEILASIRRIIADDTSPQAKRVVLPPRQPEAAPASAAPAASAAAAEDDRLQSSSALVGNAAAEAESDVLELTEPVEAGPAPAFTPVRGPDVVFRDEERSQPSPAPVEPMPAPKQVEPSAATGKDDGLLSPPSTAAVSAAFNALAATVVTEHSRTLEDITKELMRPMLKQWLDENLPSLVERLVRNEIERVSRGGR